MNDKEPAMHKSEGRSMQRALLMSRPWSGNESVLEEQKEPRVLGPNGPQRENHPRRAG